jgi:mRNA interferase RelE/StbE
MAFRVEFHPDALSENPFLGKPLANRLGINLTGFFRLYVARKKYRIVYRLVQDCLEVVEIIGIGKREKEEVYRLVLRRLQALKKSQTTAES